MRLAVQDGATEGWSPAAANDRVVPSQPLLAIDLLRRLFLFGPSDQVLGLALTAAEAVGGSPALANAVDALGIATEAGIDSGERWMNELAAEFTRLIVGPAQTPAVPYASFYLSPSRLVMTEETLAVRRRYVDAGVARRGDVRIPDDHLGIELDFLYFLEREVALAQAIGDDATVQTARGRRADFVRGHLSKWVPRFASDLLGATSHDFIRAAVALLLALLVDDGASQLDV
ncbi:MAG: molecular chaperone TorD family protein [Betaproteobacteria bacterium]|nr:molecular chaperone TorD family protein [Betaproteobacteria bacterium]